MKFLLSILSLIVACCFVNAEVLFTRSVAPKGWSLGERAKPTQPMSFMLALKQQNLDKLEERFWAVSDPDSDQYQDFMTQEQILNLIKPSPEDFRMVVYWLKKHGIKKIKNFGDALEVQATAMECEKLFDTDIHQYKNIESGEVIYRQFGSYSVPDSIKPMVEAVFGLSTFPVQRYGVHKNNYGANDINQGVIPQTLYSMYNISTQVPGKDVKLTSQGVIEFQGQYFAPSDLASYAQLTGLPIQTVPTNQIIGSNDPTQAQTEATLDIQFIAGVNVQSNNWFWIEPGNNWLYAFAVHFFSTTSVPQVISISYGWYEGDQCSINADECTQIGVDSHGYVRRVNTEFQKIGLRGVSIFSASGDSGAHTRTDEDCTAPTLRSEFPAGSPYVTTVGATQINNPTVFPLQPAACTSGGFQCVNGGTEVAVSYAVANFASGGGFSEVAPQPAYQAAAVKRYLSSGVQLPPSSYYNATNRGQPDVSAVGNANLIYQSGIQSVGGTSAATPIFAAVFSLLNEVAIKKSGKPLGFANPLLYKMWAEAPHTFNDVTSGDNICTEDGCTPGCQGYYATKGWDPVTGLGTPNVGNMREYLENMLSK